MDNGQLYINAVDPNKYTLPMRINSMSEEDIKALANGNKVHVLIAQPNDKPRSLYRKPTMPLKALTVISPVINSAVIENNNASNDYIKSIVLPPGSIEAYRLIFKWIWDMIKKGDVVRLARVEELPIIRYDGVQYIATMLGISYLKIGMIRRIGAMLNRAERPSFHMSIEEVAIIFTTQDTNHPLRKAVVDALKKASAGHTMTKTFCEGITALSAQIPSMYQELFGDAGYGQIELPFDLEETCVDDTEDIRTVIYGAVQDIDDMQN